VVLSEAVMMALAPKMGRDQAHALVLGLSRDALARGRPFREVVAADAQVRRHLTPRQVASVLEYRNYLGLAGHFVDQVLAAYKKMGARRKGRPRKQRGQA
jgi:3-carboxy-cis,cis-muconate cycloisomerase